MNKIPSYALALAMAAGAAHEAAAAAIVVDQQQTAQTVEGVAVLPSWTSIGQSFVPTGNSIDWAEFLLRAETATPVTLSVSILDGVVGGNGLGGTVVGTSASKTVNFAAQLAPVLFDFGSGVDLTPGHTYVMQVNLLTSGTLKFGSTFNAPYVDGQMFQSPYSTSLLASQDLYFREGLTATDANVPEPASFALAGLGLLALAASRGRRQ